VRQGSASGVGGGAGGGQSGTQAGASGGGGAQASGSALQGATLAVGKRLARDLYAVYERGLSGVLGTLRVFYDINRRLQLRLEAGDSTGADLVYTERIE
jgi:translocation and assembly module TamB